MVLGVLWTLGLNGLLGIGAYLVAREGFRQPSGSPRALAAVVIGWAWLTIGMQLLGTFGWMSRGPLLAWVGGLVVAGAVCRTLSGGGRLEDSTSTKVEAASWSEIGAIGLILWVSALLGGPSLFRALKVVSDGPIYHLYFAARWWKAGRLNLVAAPFGENAATYFPAGGDLWFSWLMIGWEGDLLAKVGQVPFFVLAGFTVVALARRLGAGRAASVVAATWYLASSPLILFAFEPNVDMIFNAGYLLSVHFFIRFALGDGGIESLVLGGLASGLALGTKAPAVVFVPPLIVLAMAAAVWRGGPFSKNLGGVILAGVIPFTVAGFWYARSAFLTGNLLYPFHLDVFGRVWLAGWYGPDVMRSSPYYLPRSLWGAFGDIVLAVLDPRLAPFWLAALLGAWRLGAVSRGAGDRCVWLLSGLAIMNVALYWLVIPYRTQQRFFLQALGLAAIPLARLFDRALWVRAGGVGLLAIHLLTRQSWPLEPGTMPWDLSKLIPNDIPGLIFLSGPPSALIMALVIGVCSFAMAWASLRLSRGWKNRGIALVSAAGYFGLTGMAAYPWDADARQRFYPVFPEYYRGWLAFDARCGPKGARVAYAGTDLPYYLMGVGLRNDVRYVNVDRHTDWLLHDYQRDAIDSGVGPRTWNHPRPGWDRVHPDYDSWLANLRSQGIQLLVVTRANPTEGPHNIADPYGFPIERGWADGHPESFEVLYGEREGDPQFRLYRLKPAQS